jgi:hypothetical protein
VRECERKFSFAELYPLFLGKKENAKSERDL